MRKYFLLLLFVVYGSSFSFAQEEDLLDFVWDRIETNDSALQNDLERRLVLGEDTMPSGRFKQPIKFTKGELNKIKDPRVRDVYWYALNDTTDSKRYLKAHYAFNAARDNWAFEFGGGVQTVRMNYIHDRFSIGPELSFSFKKDLHPYWAARFVGQFSKYGKKLRSVHESTFIKNWDQRPPMYSNTLEAWRQNVDYSSVAIRGDVMLNLVNLAAGDGHRVSGSSISLIQQSLLVQMSCSTCLTSRLVVSCSTTHMTGSCM